MYATKGSWLGQTFALAKANDSSGWDKSRGRRSKEERREMVETFVKRYQKLNNGSFPSLSLTRKEVGGSFYTVREIVRDIIQENRVLAPPKLPIGEQNMDKLDSFLEHYPMGSVSVDPHVHLVPPKDTQSLLNEYEFNSEVSNTSSITELHQGKLDNQNIVNGSTHMNEEELKVEEEIIDVERSVISGGNKEQNDEVIELEPTLSQISTVVVETTHETVSNEDFEEPKNTEILMERGMDGQKDAQMHHLLEDVEVETFPLRPVSSTVYNMDGKSSDREVLDGDFEENDNENGELEIGNIERFDDVTEVVETKIKDDIAGVVPESKSTQERENVENNLSTKESNVLDVNDDTDVVAADMLPAEDNALNVADGISAQNLDKTSYTIANNTNCNNQPAGSPQKKRSDATLNRINLESWEAASKKSNDQETSPLVAFVKAFITAFVKFWSE